MVLIIVVLSVIFVAAVSGCILDVIFAVAVMGIITCLMILNSSECESRSLERKVFAWGLIFCIVALACMPPHGHNIY